MKRLIIGLIVIIGSVKAVEKLLLSDVSAPYSVTFAATWMGGFCYNLKTCDEKYLNLWDR